jgi:hypothetical protein
MPISTIFLDSSDREDNIILILSKTILLKVIEKPDRQLLLKNEIAKKFVSIKNLAHDDIRILFEELFDKAKYLSIHLEFGKEKPDAGKIQRTWDWLKENAGWVVPIISNIVIEGLKRVFGA